MVCKNRFKTRGELICNNFNSFKYIKLNYIKNVFFNYNSQFNRNFILKKKTIDIFNKLKFNYLIKKINLNDLNHSFNYKLNIYNCLNIYINHAKVSKYNSFYNALGRVYALDNISCHYRPGIIDNLKILFGDLYEFNDGTKILKKNLKNFFNIFNIKKKFKIDLKLIFLYLIYIIKFLKKFIYKIGFYSQFYILSRILNFSLFNESFFKSLSLKYNRLLKGFKYFKLIFNNKFFKLFQNIYFYSFKYFKNIINIIFKRKRLKIYLDYEISNLKSLNWNQTKFGYNYFLKIALNYYSIINLIKLFYNLVYYKFKKHYKKILKKRFYKLVRFSDIVKYNLNLSLKTYNALIFSLLIKFKSYLKKNFYYILYKYTNKDQKIFFDLYLYIYKVYNKNSFLNNF